jgi:hypothetical protein
MFSISHAHHQLDTSKMLCLRALLRHYIKQLKANSLYAATIITDGETHTTLHVTDDIGHQAST